MRALTTRIEWLKARVSTSQAEVTDRSAWDWFAESCSCGLPPGDCRAHPRARPTQRPPAGDWRVWAYVAGRGAGKTRAGASWIQRRVDDGTMKLGCLIAPTSADIRGDRWPVYEESTDSEAMPNWPMVSTAVACRVTGPGYNLTIFRATPKLSATSDCNSGERRQSASCGVRNRIVYGLPV
jgi:hypothetical protein